MGAERVEVCDGEVIWRGGFDERRPRGGMTSETSPGLSGEARRNPAAGIGFGGLTAGAQRVADVARHISRISPTST